MAPTMLMQDPATCTHDRVKRTGIQRSQRGEIRLFLVTCLRCGTTLTTRTLRDNGRGRPKRRVAG